MSRTPRAVAVLALASASAFMMFARGQAPSRFNETLVSAFAYRNVGPFRMGARTSDIAVPDAPAKRHLYTFYVSFWTGGVWKTTNNGTTFEPVFDAQSEAGDRRRHGRALERRHRVGRNGRRVHVAQFVRGRRRLQVHRRRPTWKNMGLRDSHHISRIAIHPTNPDIVYVAAMGHLYSDNDERGVFRTTDGGATWEKVLYVSPKVGVIDLVMNPKNPAVLYAATYESAAAVADGQRRPAAESTRRRMAAHVDEAGWRVADGADRPHRSRHLLGNPDILYAVIENDNPRAGDGRRTRRRAVRGRANHRR